MMYDVDTLEFPVGGIRWFGPGVGRGICWVNKDFDWKANKKTFGRDEWKVDSVLLQSIGLKDIHDEDIFEGYRVRFIAIIDEIKNHKDEATGTIEWDNEDAGFYILNDNDKFPHVKLWYAESIEIIGNIYEEEG